MRIVTTSTLLISLLLNISFAQRYKTKIFTSADTTFDITYGAAKDYQGVNQDLKLDFFEPSGDVLEKRPLIIYIHGGGFTSGDKNILHILAICDNMAKRGYAVASLNYRLDPNFDIYNSNTDRRAMIDAMHDAKAAVRFFRKNANQYKIDTSFIVIGGESAGGATSMLVSYVDEQSELASYPMANPNNIEGNSGNPGYSSDVDFTMCLCALLLDTNAINTGDDPLLWVHGTDDSFVPYSLAKIITTRAENVGLAYTSYTFNGGIHCPWYTSANNWLFYLDTTLNLITDFLYPNVPSSVKEFSQKHTSIMAYPNPTSDLLMIESNAEITRGYLYNAKGEDVTHLIESNKQGKFQSQLNLRSLNAGIYYFDSGKYWMKVVRM